MTPSRPRVAYFSPLNPVLSGISDYSEELLPHLAELWDIDLFFSGASPSAPALADFCCFDVEREDALPRLSAYDATLYHVGNSPVHETIYQTLLRWPGLVVLHDFNLQNLMLERTVGRGRPDRYLGEMREQHGDDAAERARRCIYGDDAPLWESQPLQYPLNRRVLESATGILVHSRFVERLLCAQVPACPVVQLDHHALPPDGELPGPSSHSDEEVVFVTAGYLTPAKRIEVVLRALARIRDRVGVRYRLVGRIAKGHDLRGAVEALGLTDRVDFVGHVDKSGLYRELAAADVCINLRQPTLGETSGIVVRALAAGRPVVVSDAGWFSELPDASCSKIAVGGEEVASLADELLDLGRGPDRRARMASAARAYAALRDLASRARGYDRFLRTVAAGARLPLESEVARRFESLGVESSPAEREVLSQRIHSLD